MDRAIDALKREFTDSGQLEYRARRIVDQLALTMQGSLLLRHGNDRVAEAFITSRLGATGQRNYGTLGPGADVDTLVERAMPV